MTVIRRYSPGKNNSGIIEINRKKTTLHFSLLFPVVSPLCHLCDGAHFGPLKMRHRVTENNVFRCKKEQKNGRAPSARDFS